MTTSKVKKEEALILALIERWAEAVRSEDIDTVVQQHSSDILMFDLPGPVQIEGIKAYRKSWNPLFRWIRGSGRFELRDIRVTAGRDVAFATTLLDCRGKESGTKLEKIAGRLTFGFRKIDGEWLVTHEHHSEPSA